MSRYRIGFVVEPYETSEASGMGYSVRETAKALAAGAGPYELVLYSSRPLDRILIPGSYENVIVPKGFAGKFLRFLFMRKEVDLLFFVVALLPLWTPSYIRTAVICKELPDHRLPPLGLRARLLTYFRDRVLMPPCMKKAERVLASSEATKSDVTTFYSVPSERIEVIYEGYQDWTRFAPEAPQLDPALLPYFLFAGKVKGRKNVHGIVAAFIEFKKRTGSPAKLLIAGSYGGDYYVAMDRDLKAYGLRGDVHFLGYVSAPTMYSLYTNALAFVFPSLSEGFGMPLIEAMSLGVPVISSNVSALSEVVGDGGILVNPRDTSALARALEQVAGSSDLREEMRRKGRLRAGFFSWEKVAEKYATVIQELFS